MQTCWKHLSKKRFERKISIIENKKCMAIHFQRNNLIVGIKYLKDIFKQNGMREICFIFFNQ